MTDQMELSLPESKAARDKGIQQVTDSHLSWMEVAQTMAVRVLREYRHEEITGEMIRMELLNRGLSHPNKPNAWGALVMSFVRKKILFDSGRSTKMRDVRSHARRTPIWYVNRKKFVEVYG